MSEFSGYEVDRPLHLGTIHGIRAFDIDEKGRLRPVAMHVANPWKPGINTAHCLAGSWQGEHTPGSSACACGFYAYFAGENDRYLPGRVAGVIEAWGTVTVGTRGFRAEKAQIVGLVVPYPSKHRWFFCRVSHKLSKSEDREASIGLLGLALIAVGLVSSIVTLILREWGMLWTSGLTIWIGMLLFGLSAHAWNWRQRETTPADDLPALYPDARIFRTESAMLRAFPLKNPKLALKDEPDFWEKE